jgi:hypothetical protein
VIDANDIVRVSTKECRSIGTPGQAETRGNLARFRLFRTKSVHDNLALQIPNLDGIICGSAEPVTIRRKDEAVDNVSSIETVQALAFIEIPEHGCSVLSTRGTERAIRGDTNSVEVARVSNKIVAKFAVGERKDLDKTIPSARDNERNALGRREANTRDPFSVSLAFSRSNGILAFSESVPELDGLVARARDNLTVVHGEGNTENVLLVSNETTGSLSRIDFPKTKGSIPRSAQGKLAVAADYNV